MKKILALIALSLTLAAGAQDFTYSTNLFYAINYPTNIFIGTNGTDTNGDSFHVWVTKINHNFVWLTSQVKTNNSLVLSNAVLGSNGNAGSWILVEDATGSIATNPMPVAGMSGAVATNSFQPTNALLTQLAGLANTNQFAYTNQNWAAGQITNAPGFWLADPDYSGSTATNSFQPTNANLSLWGAFTPAGYGLISSNSFQPTNASLSLWGAFTPASYGLVSSNSFQPTNANLSLWSAFTPASYGLVSSNSFDPTNSAFNALMAATNSFQPTNANLSLWGAFTPASYGLVSSNSFQPTNATLSQFSAVVGGTNSLAFTNKVNTALSSYWTTNLGTASIPTNTAPPKYVYYPMTLGSSYTTPPQRGIAFIAVTCTNGALVSLSNMATHNQFTVGGITALGTNDFTASLPCAGGDIICATNLQVGGVTLGTNVWTGW